MKIKETFQSLCFTEKDFESNKFYYEIVFFFYFYIMNIGVINISIKN
jgi:hypothetical protein